MVVTLAHDVARRTYVRRKFGKSGRLTTYPAGLVFAIGLILVSRLFHLQPGFVFGLMTGLAFSNRLTDREDGRSLALATVIVLTVAFAAWFAWVPVKASVAATSSPSFSMITLDTLLATIWVAGVQPVVFALLPLRFLDGEKVAAWSRAGWAVIYFITLTVFVQTILQPTTERFGGHASLLALAALLGGFSLLALAAWSYSTLRLRRLRGVEAATT